MSDLVTSRNFKRVLTFGVFDSLHKGHLNLLQQASVLGDYLIVVVARDSFVRSVKKNEPVDNERRRMKEVEAIDCVDEVVLGDDWPVKDRYGLLGRLDFDVLALGYDQNYCEAKVIEKLKIIGKEDVLVVRLKSFSPGKYKSSYFR